MSSRGSKAFLDTNVLVYLFDHDNPAKEQRARAILQDAAPDDLVLSTQVLSEFYVTVTRKLSRPVDEDTATQAVDWLSFLPVLPIDETLIKAAIETARSAQLSYWDGLIVAAATHGGCERLLTEDLNDGQRIRSIQIENPFRDLD